MFDVPSNDTPPIVLAVSNCVVEAATPVKLPVTLPVKAPTNPVAVTIPDALISPNELIPTPFCPELTSFPT